jgi:hypothetical protein
VFCWLFVSREAAKTRSGTQGRWSVWRAVGGDCTGAEGWGALMLVMRALPCRGRCCHAMGSVAPSPPTPLPRFTGARGGLCVRWPVRRAADGSPRVAVTVARAFQPEICPSATGKPGDRWWGAGRLVASREAAKPRRKAGGGWWAFFEYEYEYEYRPPGRTEYEYEGRPLGDDVFAFFVVVCLLEFCPLRPLFAGWRLGSSGFSSPST